MNKNTKNNTKDIIDKKHGVKKQGQKKKCFGVNFLIRFSIYFGFFLLVFLIFNLTELFEILIKTNEVHKIKETQIQFTNFTDGKMNFAFGLFYQNNSLFSLKEKNTNKSFEYFISIVNINKISGMKTKTAINISFCPHEGNDQKYNNKQYSVTKEIINELLCIIDNASNLVSYSNDKEESYIEFNLEVNISNDVNKLLKERLKLVIFYTEFSLDIYDKNHNFHQFSLVTNAHYFYIDNNHFIKETLEFTNINITMNDKIYLYKRYENYLNLINSKHEKVISTTNLTRKAQVRFKASKVRQELDLSYSAITIIIKNIFFLGTFVASLFIACNY